MKFCIQLNFLPFSFSKHVELSGKSITQIWQFGTLADLAKSLSPLGMFLRIFESYNIIHHAHVHFEIFVRTFFLSQCLNFHLYFLWQISSFTFSDIHFHCLYHISTFTSFVRFICSLYLSDLHFHFLCQVSPLTFSVRFPLSLSVR